MAAEARVAARAAARVAAKAVFVVRALKAAPPVQARIRCPCRMRRRALHGVACAWLHCWGRRQARTSNCRALISSCIGPDSSCSPFARSQI
eukprot:7391072-Prymnesium_polylepis.1